MEQIDSCYRGVGEGGRDWIKDGEGIRQRIYMHNP